MFLGKGNYRPACSSSFRAGFKKHEFVYTACLCLQTLEEGWGGSALKSLSLGSASGTG